MEDLTESLTSLERDLGLPEGFCLKLKVEDDWSFVIKLHALIECAVAEQLTRTFERKELADVFSRFELSNTKTGKLALIKALNLLPLGHVQFIRNLSELRNALAHKVQNVNLSLVEYFRTKTAKYRPNEVKKFADQWAFAIKVKGEKYSNQPMARFSATITAKEEIPEGVIFDRARFLLGAPKDAIWFTALTVLDAISLCNRYGPQMWSFLMECEDRKDCEDWVHELFARAKVGDPGLPEQMARKFERLMPHARVARNEDGQPILESLAAAMNERKKQLLEEL
jgi:hypothetical protein